MSLTERSIPSLAPGRHTDSRGLYLLIGKTTRTWQFKRRGTWTTIGTWPAWSCVAARARAGELAVQDDKGRPMGLTLKDAYILWRDRKIQRAASTFYWHKGTFKNHFCDGAEIDAAGSAGWRDRDLTKITRSDLVRRHDQIVRKSGPMAARTAMLAFSAWWRRARKLDPLLPECPAVAVDLHPLRKKNGTDVYQRLSEWHAALMQMRCEVRRELFLFALLTGLRRDSLRRARWEHLRGDVLHVPTPKRARGEDYRPFDLPLLDEHMEVLARLRRIGAAKAPHSPWVFPGDTSCVSNTRLTKSDAKLWKSLGAPIFTTHDMRRCFVTAATDAGVHSDIRAKLVNHKIAGVSDHYIVSGLNLRRAMAATVNLLQDKLSGRKMAPPPASLATPDP